MPQDGRTAINNSNWLSHVLYLLSLGVLPAPHAASHELGGSDELGLDASQIVSGVLDLARIPAAALERLVYVADQTARYALTTATVQLGDVVKQNDTGALYFVKDESNLNNANGYEQITTPGGGYKTTITGDAVNDTFSVTHSLGTLDCIVQVYDMTTAKTVEVDVTRTSTSAVSVAFQSIPASGKQYRVLVTAIP